jgi:hypothetical protein
MPSGTLNGDFFTRFYCVDNTGVPRPATANDLAAVGAWGSDAPPSIKEEHRAAKRAEARAAGAGEDAAGDADRDAAGAGEDAMDVDGSPNRNPNGNRNLPGRRIDFD